MFHHNEAELNVTILGTGRIPAVLIHGLGGSSESWIDVPPTLARLRQVVVPDLRGCGRSQPIRADLSLAMLADDVVATLDHLQVRRCHVVGHSFGGVIAQHLVTRHNARVVSATFISTSARVGPKATGTWRRLADAVEERGFVDSPAARARAFSEEFARTNPETVNHLTALAAESDAHTYAIYARLASSYDYTTELALVSQSALVIQGLADRMTPPAGSVLLHRAMQHGQLEMVEGAGHNVHIEMGSRFVERLEQFFQDIERAC